MDSNSNEESSFSSEEEVEEMTRLVESDLRVQLSKATQQIQEAYGESQKLRSLCFAQKERITQLEAELETLKGDFQDLNLLDGFLRSGIARTLSLQDDPELQGMLRVFLGRTLQTALDRGAVNFASSLQKKEDDS